MKSLLKNLKIRKNQRGTSLVELLVYLAILTTILIVASDLLIRSGEFSLKSSGTNFLQEDADFIISRFTYEIHRSSAVVTPATLGTSSNSLRITIPCFLCPSEDRQFRLLNGNLLYERLIAATPSANLNSNRTKINAGTLSFTRLGNVSGKPTIKIVFELEAIKKPKGGPLKEIFQTVVGTR